MAQHTNSEKSSPMTTIRKRHVARTLLIELLACQFAFPVRWIETQDELFSSKEGISRFVEFGPTKILGGMAKQTIDLKYRNHDLSKLLSRLFLCSESDLKSLSYEYDPPAEEPIAGPMPDIPSITSDPIPPLPTEKFDSMAAKVEDVPIQARDVITSLVARKFKNAFDNLDVGRSIKELSGGKSALQNELMGILEQEFSNVPSGAEELPLSVLSEKIEPNFGASLGKESSSTINKFISTRMPAGFSQSAIRAYMEDTWGLGQARQTVLLLFAITAEPTSRLSSVEAAKEYFGSLASRYAKSCGFSLGTKPTSSVVQSSAVAVDSKELDALRKEHTDVLLQNFHLLASQLNIDPSNSSKFAELNTVTKDYEARLNDWTSEFEIDFETGIVSKFDSRKRRCFNAWWNLVREDVLRLYHDTLRGTTFASTKSSSTVLRHICNRSTIPIYRLVNDLLDCDPGTGYKNNPFESIGSALSTKLFTSLSESPKFVFLNEIIAPHTTISNDGAVKYTEVPRRIPGVASYNDLLERGTLRSLSRASSPYLLLKTAQRGAWQNDPHKTTKLLETLRVGTTSGFSFSRKSVLLTGASAGSIGNELLRGLLIGGARVIVTTSRSPSQIAQYYQSLYAECGSRGSELILLPFNQASKRDCESLIDYIYSDNGLAINLDAVIPFAAISEAAEIDRIESKSELAHRIMLVNVLRLLGHIVRNKESRNMRTRPTQVLLPLSPNQGTFGGDGLYSESKLGLEALLRKARSESWSDFLSVCGALIGWTRGTGLMASNDLVAQAIESHDVLTFSQHEMAFILLGLTTPSISTLCETEPVIADLGGGLGGLSNLKSILATKRRQIENAKSIRTAIMEENVHEERDIEGPESSKAHHPPSLPRLKSRSTLRVGYPSLPDYDAELLPLRHLQGMVNLESVPVIVGFSELGPWGSSRTRWEMETRGTFSQEGYLEMAWFMNLIKYHEGEKNGISYAGWVDAKTEQPILDSEVGHKYGEYIMNHSGIRVVEPDLFQEDYDPDRKEFMHEVALEADLPEFEASSGIAEAFKLRHGDKVSVKPCQDSDMFKLQLKKGATIVVPKSVPFEGNVAGQIPTGWDPSQYGIPEDIKRQVDPVTLYALCCVSEALYSAGISESMEIFQHIHTSEIGNFIGSMMGGITKTRHMYRNRYLDKEVQGDVMQETYLSTTAAWINMLLLGASGPIKTPTGACATAVESIDSACESLLSGKTKICFVGGTDDFQEEEAYAFRTMKATIDARKELANGRLPHEMSRPTSDTRAGFVESQGSGVQIITTAKLALDLGLPIYTIIASSTMAADKISRSVPAPGQGVLSFARETPEAAYSPFLDIEFRREQMSSAISSVHRWRDSSLQKVWAGAAREDPVPSPTSLSSSSSGASTPLRSSLSSEVAIEKAASVQIAQAQRLWGNEFRRQDPDISPLRAALAVWGLTVDDIDIASLHGTSTKANDTNEPDILNKQMSHLGRNENRPLMAICQKSLTGHPKAPAAAFMLNGCLQALQSGLVPGNRNADNVDIALSAYPHLVFPTRPIQTRTLKAFSLTSFGFGQKGGQVIGVHPRYLFATIHRADYESYSAVTLARTRSTNQAYLRAMASNRIVKLHNSPPYVPEIESTVVLDPRSRISRTAQTAAWAYDPSNLHRSDEDDDGDDVTLCSTPPRRDSSEVQVAAALSKLSISDMLSDKRICSIGTKVGIDVEEVAAFQDREGSFYERNYTTDERLWASQMPDPVLALAGRWTAKEAVFKSLDVASKGAGAPLKEIEIVNRDGAPGVKLHGDAYSAAQDKGIQDIRLSLSHSGNTVVAVALAMDGDGNVATY